MYAIPCKVSSRFRLLVQLGKLGKLLRVRGTLSPAISVNGDAALVELSSEIENRTNQNAPA